MNQRKEINQGIKINEGKVSPGIKSHGNSYTLTGTGNKLGNGNMSG